MVGDVFCESLPGGVGGAKQVQRVRSWWCPVVGCLGVCASRGRHCRVYFQHLILNRCVWLPCVGGCCWLLFVGGCVVWGVGVCCCMFGWLVWLVGCGWWVVGELYSGCFVSLFCVIFVFVLVFCFCGRSVDALVSRADEGRGGLRYALGS